MSGYVCITPDTATTGCLEWAQAWSLADLSMSEAVDIVVPIALAWSIAWGINLLVHHTLLNKR